MRTSKTQLPFFRVAKQSVFRRWASILSDPLANPPRNWQVLFFGTDTISLPTLRALYSVPTLVSEVAVVCPPDIIKPCEVKQFADQKGLKIYQPEDLNKWNLPAPTNGKPWDIAVVCSYGKFIPEQILTTLPHGGINMHPSYVPFYRGAAPLMRQIETGDRVGAISVIQVHPKQFDIGSVLLQWPFQIPETAMYSSLASSCADRGAHAIVEVLLNYDKYQSLSKPQRSPLDPIEVVHQPPPVPLGLSLQFDTQNLLEYPFLKPGLSIGPNEGLSAASKRPLHARLVKPEDGEISWKKLTAQQVYCKWRAFSEKIGCYTHFNWPVGTSQKLRLKLLRLEHPGVTSVVAADVKPGSAWFLKKTRTLHIKCADRTISCSQLQVSGKVGGDAERFLNGYLHAFPNRIIQFCEPE